MTTPVIERLFNHARIDEITGCWEWTGARIRGYGQIRTEAKVAYVHRVAYELLLGPIPAGLQIDHLCQNRSCFNVDHLEPVTPRENILRSPIALRALHATKTHCPQGHKYSPENTYRYPDGSRDCRTCRRVRVAEWRLRTALNTRQSVHQPRKAGMLGKERNG